jgi:glycosyltransferase involved in cell wall biosynthesis
MRQPISGYARFMDAPLSASSVEARPLLKIALLGYRSNPYSGGQGVYLKHLSKALVDLGHRVDVISGEPYPQLDPRVGLIKLPGLNMYAQAQPMRALSKLRWLDPINLFEWLSFVSGGFPEPFTFGHRLRRYFKQQRPDYDIVHDNQSLCTGLLSLRRQGYAVTSTIHHPITFDLDIALQNNADWGLALLIKRWHLFLRMQIRVARLLPFITTVSGNSKRDIAAAFELPSTRISVVLNGIDTEMFQPQPDVAREPFHLITTASADQPLKGTQHLIPAVAELVERYPQLHLTFIGAPKPGGKTEQLIEAMGLTERIEFHHGIEFAEIAKLYARASVAVVPSEYEGFGFPAGEAMACEVPLVSTDGGALPEVVGDAGLVVPSKSPEALAQAIAYLFDHPAERLRLSRAGRKRIVEQFSWARAAQEFTQHYHQVIDHES